MALTTDMRKRNRELVRLATEDEKKRLDEKRKRRERLLDAFTDYRAALDHLRGVAAESLDAGMTRKEIGELLSLAGDVGGGELALIFHAPDAEGTGGTGDAKTAGGDAETDGPAPGQDDGDAKTGDAGTAWTPAAWDAAATADK